MAKVKRTAAKVDRGLQARVEKAEAMLRLDRIRIARAAAKVALAAYKGADKNRTNKDWPTRRLSADAAVLPDSANLVARSREMGRNEAYGVSIPRAFVRNVVGGRGITVSPSTATLTSPVDQAIRAEFDRRIGDLWHDWTTRPERCDMERRRTFAGIQRWAVREIVEAGGCLVVMSEEWVDGMPHLRLQLVEYEQLDDQRQTYVDPATRESRDVRGGVEVNEYGAAVAYWIWKDHPFDIGKVYRSTAFRRSGDSYRVPADRVCHVYEPDRARQTLGAPRTAAALERMRNLTMYDAAQLLAARAEACIGMAIKSPDPGTDKFGMAQSVSDPHRQDSDGNDEIAFQPLMVARLNPGEDITPFVPQRPGNAYQPYMQANLRAIAAAAGISYEQLARDFTNGSYSSQRQAKLEDRNEFEILQEEIVAKLCRPVWNQFVRLAVARGDVRAPGFSARPDDWTYATWMPPRDEWIDPKNEAEADAIAIENTFDTKTALLARRGLSFEEVARQRAKEIELERSLGLEVPIAP